MSTSIDRGPGALQYLRENGLSPRQLTIRSSDFNTVFTCPFLYYLCRRIGLVPAARWSKALARGSWFHAHLEQWNQTTKARHVYAQRLLNLRCQELRATLGSSEAAKGFEEREVRDEGAARAWVDCLLEMNLPGGSTVAQRFGSCSVLAIEPTLRFQLEGGAWTAIQPDLLLLDPTNQLIIIDWKSTSGPARDRLAACPLEDQTRHYVWLMDQILRAGILGNQLQTTLPDNVRLGSMMHIAFQKCPLEFCNSDAPREWVSDGKRSGIKARGIPFRDQWQGLVEGQETKTFLTEVALLSWMHDLTGKKPESIIIGAPDYNRYLARVRQWYKADGPYTHLSTDRLASDVVDVSTTNADLLLSSEHMRDYLHDLNQVAHYATVEPEPRNFPRRAHHLVHRNGLSPYLGFYMNPVNQWPSIALRENMIVTHRDQPIEAIP
jgi:hypothetical protein